MAFHPVSKVVCDVGILSRVSGTDASKTADRVSRQGTLMHNAQCLAAFSNQPINLDIVHFGAIVKFDHDDDYLIAPSLSKLQILPHLGTGTLYIFGSVAEWIAFANRASAFTSLAGIAKSVIAFLELQGIKNVKS